MNFVGANPVLLFVAAATTAAYAVQQWANATEAAAKSQTEFLQKLAATTNALRKQAEAVRTLDDYRQELTNLDKEETSIKEQLAGLGERPAEVVRAIPGGMGGLGAIGTSKIVTNSEELSEYDMKKGGLEDSLRRIQLTRTKLKNRSIDSLGQSKEEQQRAVDEADRERRLRDAREQVEIDRADGAGKERLLRNRSARLAGEATSGQDIAAGRLRPEAYANKPTELMQVAKQISDLEKAGQNVPKSLLQHRADLANLGDTYQEKRAQSLQDNAEADQLRETIALKRMELDIDNTIADARKRGAETSAAETAKELLLLEKQLQIAQTKGAAGELEARAIQSRINTIRGDQGKARAEIGLDRARNNALINGNPKAAQAVTDFEALQKLRDRYKAAGLSSEQADADFNRSIMAQAAQTTPRIVADSLQRVGGGGGSYGSNPMLTALQRQDESNKRREALLAIIAKNTADGGVVK